MINITVYARINGNTRTKTLYCDDFNDFEEVHRTLLDAFGLPCHKRYIIQWVAEQGSANGYYGQISPFAGQTYDLSEATSFDNFKSRITSASKELRFIIAHDSPEVHLGPRCGWLYSPAPTNKVVPGENQLLKPLSGSAKAHGSLKSTLDITQIQTSSEYRALQKELSCKLAKIKLLETANSNFQNANAILESKVTVLKSQVEALREATQKNDAHIRFGKKKGYSELHPTVYCDACPSPEPFLRGSRYHCNDCENYDLCSPCYHSKKASREHNLSHNVTKVHSGLLLKNDQSQILFKPKDNKHKSLAITLLGTCNSYETLSELKAKADKYDRLQVAGSIQENSKQVDLKRQTIAEEGVKKQEASDIGPLKSLETNSSRKSKDTGINPSPKALSDPASAPLKNSQTVFDVDLESEINEEEFCSVLMSQDSEKTQTIVNFDSDQEEERAEGDSSVISDDEIDDSLETASIGSYDILSTDNYTE